MKLKGLKLSEQEVSQEFDLKEILGMDISGDRGLQEAIGQAIVDRIVERTQSGKDVSGRSFAKYSESYKRSLEFQAFGKSDRVDMTLSGDMLSLLTITEIKDGKLKIGWSDSKNNAKAYGHITGMEGHEFLEGKTPKRNFFGLTEAETKALREEFRPDFAEGARSNDASLVEKISRLLGA